MLTIDEIVTAAEVVAKEYPIKYINLFGSYAEGKNTTDSDVDILVEFETEAVSLLTICSLKNRLEEILNTPVDVVHAPIPENSILEIGKVVPLYAA
ncbi:MAG: nucleotidyltransferase domain-containing protein [Clostridia bacterium]|nr:nucleotidyltransferase domain-containing protein [Clostridia bacterium]